MGDVRLVMAAVRLLNVSPRPGDVHPLCSDGLAEQVPTNGSPGR